jgi:hypothetical protein
MLVNEGSSFPTAYLTRDGPAEDLIATIRTSFSGEVSEWSGR